MLGSLPVKHSIAAQQYYALPRNTFWPIICRLLKAPANLDYQSRTEFLVSHRLALWDVLAASVRPGSLDSNIVDRTARPNDLQGFIAHHASLKLICFNGRKAEVLFRRHIIALGGAGIPNGIVGMTMPSTSPAYAAMPFEEKLHSWARLLNYL